MTDGSNAKIVEGSIDTTVTVTPSGVSSGDGQLATDGLEIVNTSGIIASPEFTIALDPVGLPDSSTIRCWLRRVTNAPRTSGQLECSTTRPPEPPGSNMTR